MTISIYNNAGVVIGTSQNLRGILDRNRSMLSGAAIEVSPRMGGAEFYIQWRDGSWASTTFCSYDICVDFAGRKAFAGATIKIHPYQIFRSKKSL